MDKINLKNIFNKHANCRASYDATEKALDESMFEEAMLEFGKQLLELASKNAKGKPFPMNKTGVIKYSDVDKQSITSTIKQVEYEENNN